jgi:cation transport ATPase
MAISFLCPDCDTAHKVPDRMAGKTKTCDECQTRILIPEMEPVEDTPKKKPKSVRSAIADDDDEEYTPKKKSSGVSSAAEDAAYYAHKEAKRRRKNAVRREMNEHHSGASSLSISRALIGGIMMMAIAGGLSLLLLFAFQRFSIWLIILFICGFISFIKGLMGYSDD